MISLANKYRPLTFEDVCSQESIITILRRQLELKQLKNCYLFCGPSGCGKTTTARIFASELNNHLGTPIEIDGASNNGVENVRQIIDTAANRALDGKYKIYIMDECHALSSQAWQAMLKLIEEPPEYTIFIFCTTDPQKIPATILNRMMRFNFTRIPVDIIQTRLEAICAAEQFTNYVDACDYISRICNGQLRDAISMLDKCASYNTDLTLNNVLNALGDFTYDSLFELVNNLIDGNEANTLKIITQLYNDGNDLKKFIDHFLTFCLDISKYVLFQSIQMTSIPNNMEEKLKYAVAFDSAKQYYTYLVNKILDCKNMIKNDQNAKSTIEVCLLNICRCQ